MASLARHIYIRAPIGVKTVKRIYGGMWQQKLTCLKVYVHSLIYFVCVGHKNNGVRPSHFCGSSGSVARKVLQALEAIKLVEKDAAGGRRLTSQGFRDLDRIASQIKSSKAWNNPQNDWKVYTIFSLSPITRLTPTNSVSLFTSRWRMVAANLRIKTKLLPFSKKERGNYIIVLE